MARAEGSFDGGFEAVELVIRDEREGRAGEAAAVDAHRALAAARSCWQSAMVNAISCFSMYPAGVTFCSSVHDAMPDSLT